MKLVLHSKIKANVLFFFVVFCCFFVRLFLKSQVSMDSLSLMTFAVTALGLIMWVAGNLRVAFINPIALRMAKTLWSFGVSECNRVQVGLQGCWIADRS